VGEKKYSGREHIRADRLTRFQRLFEKGPPRGSSGMTSVGANWGGSWREKGELRKPRIPTTSARVTSVQGNYPAKREGSLEKQEPDARGEKGIGVLVDREGVVECQVGWVKGIEGGGGGHMGRRIFLLKLLGEYAPERVTEKEKRTA